MYICHRASVPSESVPSAKASHNPNLQSWTRPLPQGVNNHNGDMSDRIRVDEWTLRITLPDPRSFLPHMQFHISATLILIISFFPLNFPPSPTRVHTAHPRPPLQSTAQDHLDTTKIIRTWRDLLVCFYPVSIPIAPRTELDITWPWHGGTQLPQPVTSRARAKADIKPGHARRVSRCSGVSRHMVQCGRSWHATNFAQARQSFETGIC